jgi:hypothetical protein
MSIYTPPSLFSFRSDDSSIRPSSTLIERHEPCVYVGVAFGPSMYNSNCDNVGKIVAER